MKTIKLEVECPACKAVISILIQSEEIVVSKTGKVFKPNEAMDKAKKVLRGQDV